MAPLEVVTNQPLQLKAGQQVVFNLASHAWYVCCCLFPAGPVAAAYKAIDQLYDLDHVPELTEYTVNSLTEGIEALVTTRLVPASSWPPGKQRA
jgi:hypothetical protein